MFGNYVQAVVTGEGSEDCRGGRPIRCPVSQGLCAQAEADRLSQGPARKLNMAPGPVLPGLWTITDRLMSGGRRVHSC